MDSHLSLATREYALGSTDPSAKLLSRLMFADPTLNGYTDIGRKAFGPWAGGMINVLFCTELFALGYV